MSAVCVLNFQSSCATFSPAVGIFTGGVTSAVVWHRTRFWNCHNVLQWRRLRKFERLWRTERDSFFVFTDRGGKTA